MCPGLSHYRLAHRDDGEHPACSESVILPMCNVIYLGMQRYLSRGPRGGGEAGARARGRPRRGGGWPRAAHGDVARLQINIKNARDVLGDRGRSKAPTPPTRTTGRHRGTARGPTASPRYTSPTQLATHGRTSLGAGVSLHASASVGIKLRPRPRARARARAT